MNSKTVLAIYTIIAGLAAVTIASFSLSNMSVNAASPSDPNCFGQAAAAQGGDLGEHSRNGGAAGTAPYDKDGKPGRDGIGNVGEDLGITDTKHPSDLAAALGANCN